LHGALGGGQEPRSKEIVALDFSTMVRLDWALACAGVALGLAAMAVDHLLGDDPGLEDPPAFLISAAVILLVAALLFGGVVRRARDPRRASFIVALLGVASLPLIWLGAPFAVAPAAIALGLRSEGRLATAAIAISVVVLLAVTGAYVYDGVDKLA
jgi:hypothetical protein